MSNKKKIFDATWLTDMIVFTAVVDLVIAFVNQFCWQIVVGLILLLLLDIATYQWCKKNSDRYRDSNHLSMGIGSVIISSELFFGAMQIVLWLKQTTLFVVLGIVYVACIYAWICLARKREPNDDAQNQEKIRQAAKMGTACSGLVIVLVGYVARHVGISSNVGFLILAGLIFCLAIILALGYSHLVYFIQEVTNNRLAETEGTEK